MKTYVKTNHVLTGVPVETEITRDRRYRTSYRLRSRLVGGEWVNTKLPAHHMYIPCLGYPAEKAAALDDGAAVCKIRCLAASQIFAKAVKKLLKI